MIGRKGNLVLAAVLAVLVGIDFATWPRSNQARVAEPLFAPFPLSAIQRVRVFDPAEQGAANTLEVIREGEAVFRLQQAQGFPARPRVVENLASGLASMTTLDLLSEDPESHPRYGLTAETAVRVTLLDDAGQVLADLLQGDMAPGGRASYVRRTDSNEVYRAPLFVQRVRTDPLVWLESRWMPLDPSLVQRIRVTEVGEEPLECRLILGSRLEWHDTQDKPIGAGKMRNLMSGLSRATMLSIERSGQPAWSGAKGTILIEVEQAGGLVWRGNLAAWSQAGPKEATVERDGVYQVRLAPAIAEVLFKSIGELRK